MRLRPILQTIRLIKLRIRSKSAGFIERGKRRKVLNNTHLSLSEYFSFKETCLVLSSRHWMCAVSPIAIGPDRNTKLQIICFRFCNLHPANTKHLLDKQFFCNRPSITLHPHQINSCADIMRLQFLFIKSRRSSNCLL